MVLTEEYFRVCMGPPILKLELRIMVSAQWSGAHLGTHMGMGMEGFEGHTGALLFKKNQPHPRLSPPPSGPQKSNSVQSIRMGVTRSNGPL